MKQVILGKTAGFCFGVQRAVDLAEETAKSAGTCATLGPIIHNRHVVEHLARLGVSAIAAPEEALPGSRVIIRSHGVGRETLAALAEQGVQIIDATCPDVKKIHRIIEAADQAGRQVVIVGERDHPEVVAAANWCETPFVAESAQELETWLLDGNRQETPLSVVFQTTGDRENMERCRKILKKWCTSAEFFDTICRATSKRQEEAACLASFCDAMVVIGGKNSANSQRLAEICQRRGAPVFFIEDAGGLPADEFDEFDTVGIIAGASTPAWIIKEVYQTMRDEFVTNTEETLPTTPAETQEEAVAQPAPEAVEEVIAEEASVEAAAVPEETISEEPAPEEVASEETVSEEAAEPAEGEIAAEDESFEAMLEKSIKTLHTGEKVVGIVAAITPTEVSVELGTKHSAYIPIDELTDDPEVNIEDLIKVGGEVEAYVMRVNDVEGMVMLSKKRLDTVKYWDEIDQARDKRIVVEGIITEENKGGLVAKVKGVRVFIPASQTGVPKDEPMSHMLRQKVKLRITEVNQSRRRVVGSIRMVSGEERREKAEKTWNEIEVGKRYTGKVKSLTSYGAFIDIGGVDGMVHVSELSWSRIKSPADVLKVGDEIEVYILSFDKEKGKISLGHKDPSLNPWKTFTDQYEKGSVAKVRIVKLMPFGAFAEIVPGVDGLIHISQIADRRIGRPNEFLSEGQEIDVQIIDIDYDKKNVSLSIRALVEEPKEAPPADEFEESAGGEDAIVYDTDVNKPVYDDEEVAEEIGEEVVEEIAAETVEKAVEETVEEGIAEAAVAEAVEEVIEAVEEAAIDEAAEEASAEVAEEVVAETPGDAIEELEA